MENNQIAPMYENRYLAHAMGGFHGHRYLNAEEALDNAITCGYRYFEVDLSLTEDGAVVCTHGWSRKDCKKVGMLYHSDFSHMTGEKFLAQKVFGMRTMDARALYARMKAHPDFYWELDLHNLSREKAALITERIVEAFEHDENALDHCLVQVESKDMYRGIHSVYPFRYYQFHVMKHLIARLDEFILFCLENGICAMAVNESLMNRETVSKIRDAGLALLAFTVDSKERALELFELGVNTVCTNFIDLSQDATEEETQREIAEFREQQKEINRLEKSEKEKVKEEEHRKNQKKKLLTKIVKNLKQPVRIPGKCIKLVRKKLEKPGIEQ